MEISREEKTGASKGRSHLNNKIFATILKVVENFERIYVKIVVKDRRRNGAEM